MPGWAASVPSPAKENLKYQVQTPALFSLLLNLHRSFLSFVLSFGRLRVQEDCNSSILVREMSPDENQRDRSTRSRNLAKSHLNRETGKAKRPNKAGNTSRRQGLAQKDHAPSEPSPLVSERTLFNNSSALTPQSGGHGAEPRNPMPLPAAIAPPGPPPYHETFNLNDWCHFEEMLADPVSEEVLQIFQGLGGPMGLNENRSQSGYAPELAGCAPARLDSVGGHLATPHDAMSHTSGLSIGQIQEPPHPWGGLRRRNIRDDESQYIDPRKLQKSSSQH